MDGAAGAGAAFGATGGEENAANAAGEAMATTGRRTKKAEVLEKRGILLKSWDDFFLSAFFARFFWKSGNETW